MAVTITETRGHVAEMTPNSHLGVPVTMDRNGRSRSPKYAEMLVGEAFRLKGYRIEELGGRGADGGIDLVLRKSGKKFLVQCKQWRSYKVGVGVIREHFGVMTAEKADGGFVVTSGRFTAEARVFAKGFHIERNSPTKAALA
jgi:restriction endonuclease Mrr